MKMDRTAEQHSETFKVGQSVYFRGSGEGPFLVAEVKTIPDGPARGADPEDVWPREAAGHHQHVIIVHDDRDGGGAYGHTYSGAWLTADEPTPEDQ